MAITDPIAATYVNSTTFTATTDAAGNTDLREQCAAGVRIKADCGADGYKYGIVSAASYSAPTTTIQIVGDSLTSNLTSFWHSNDNPASLVNHGHTSAADGGFIEIERVLGYDELVLAMSGLHGYWPLNDVTAAGVLPEASGNGAAGATNLKTNVNLHHKNVIPTGAGKALQLGASTSDRATFTIPSLASGFTISVWHRTNAISATSRQIFAIDSSYGTAQPFCILKTTDTQSPPVSFLGVYSDDTVSGSQCPNPAASYSSQYLHHYVARFDGLQAELFFNGVSCGKGTSLAGETMANLTTLVLGTGYWSHAIVDPCPGLYNGLAVFTRAITDNEVAQLYQAGVGGGVKGERGDPGEGVEWADTAETQAGTLTNKAVTPAGAAATYSPLGHDHAATYAPLAKGVTSGDSHNHDGGDGGQISYTTLADLPTIPVAAETTPANLGSAGPGTAATWSKADHVHNMPTAANVGALASGADINLSDYKVQRPYLQDWSEVVNAMGSISGAQTIDMELSNVVTATITAATTFTFTNPPASGRAGGFILELTNGGAGVIIWPESCKGLPKLTETLTTSGLDKFAFMTIDGGMTYTCTYRLDIK